MIAIDLRGLDESSGNPSGIDGNVEFFADLPNVVTFAGQIYVVEKSSGVWLINRKNAGMYRSNGVDWVAMDDFPDVFSDANFEVFNDSDNTKAVKFDVSNLTTALKRIIKWPDKNLEFLGNGTGLNYLDDQGNYTDPLDGVKNDLPAIQILDASYVLTGAFADVPFATTSIENDSNVLEHNNTFTERIEIKEDGLYLFGYKASHNEVAPTTDTFTRIRKNGTTTLLGSEGQETTVGGFRFVKTVTDPELFLAGDFVTFQVQGGGGTMDSLSFWGIKLQGTKGDKGNAGAGSSIIVQKDDVTIGTVTDELNFEGTAVISVVDEGLNKTTVTINQAIQEGHSGTYFPIVNATDTTFVAAFLFTKMLGSTQEMLEINDMSTTDNRLTNTSTLKRRFLVSGSISTMVGTVGEVFAIQIVKNGTLTAQQIIQAGSITIPSERMQTRVEAYFDLEENDFVELWISNFTSTNNIRGAYYELTAHEIFKP